MRLRPSSFRGQAGRRSIGAAARRGPSRLLVAGLALGLAQGCGDEPGIRKVPATGFFDPPEINFGVRNVGLTYALPTVLSNTSGQAIQVRRVRFAPATDVFLPRREDGGTFRGTTLAPGTRVGLSIRYAPREVGTDDVVMTVEFADFEIDVPIRASAERVAPATPAMTPTSVTFSDVPINGEARQTVELTNVGETDGALQTVQVLPPLSVQRVGGGALTLPGPLLSPGASMQLEVVYAPRDLRRVQQQIAFGLDTEQEASLMVVGQPAEVAVLTCAPEVLAFGEVPRGQLRTGRVACQATGGPYTLAQVRFARGSSESFRLATFPSGVDATGRLDLDLEFVSDSLPRVHAAALELVADHGGVTVVQATARTVPPDPSTTAVTIQLVWNTARSDFDLHLIREDGVMFRAEDDCFWASKNPAWGRLDDRLDDPFLDRDDVDGFGPETINLSVTSGSRYDVYVQYFGYDGPVAPPTTAEVQVGLNGRSPETFSRAMDTCGTTWHVGWIELEAGRGTFISADALTDAYRPRAEPKCQ